MSKLVIDDLLKREWSTGNGVCSECYGAKPGKWAPHPCVPSTAFEGHQTGCEYASRMESMGLSVHYQEIPKKYSLIFAISVEDKDYESRKVIDKFKKGLIQ